MAYLKFVAALLMVISQSPLASLKPLFNECVTDMDCGDGRYCLGEGDKNICEICVTCTHTYKRQNSTQWRNCAKTVSECGPCLEGLMAQELTGNQYSNTCFLKKNQSDPGPTATNENLIYICVGIVLTALVTGACATCYYKKWKTANDSVVQPEEQKRLNSPNDASHCDAPPPYSDPSTAPCAPHYIEVFYEEDRLNMAQPYGRRHPGPFEEYDENDETLMNTQDIYEDNAQVLEEDSGSTETIPSLWEPGSTTNVVEEESQDDDDDNRVALINHSNPNIGSTGATMFANRQRRHSRTRSLDLRATAVQLPDSTALELCSPGGSESRIFEATVIRLSEYRLCPQQPTDDRRVSTSQCDPQQSSIGVSQYNSDEDDEPEPPQSFFLPDHEDGDVSRVPNSTSRPILFRSISQGPNHGSNDSGFFSHTQSPLRRPASEQNEITFALLVKRRRED